MTSTPEDRLALYDELIASRPDIERKGKTMPYTSLNGHMFSHLDKTGTMGLRLPADQRDRFLKKYGTTLFRQHGRVMTEYVTVPQSLLEDPDELRKYLDKSVEHIRSLKPKPTKRKKT